MGTLRNDWLELCMPECSMRSILHLVLFHALLRTADPETSTNPLEVRLKLGMLRCFPWRSPHDQIAKYFLV